MPAAPVPCPACRAGEPFRLAVGMAFQPIVDLAEGRVFAHEALVRGPDGQPAEWVLERVADAERYAFDRECRVTAIREAARLGLAGTGALLSINFLPNAVYEPRNCLRATLAAAERARFPLRSIMFEITEAERVRDPGHLRRIVEAYKEMGFTVAIDDFGAGHAGLGLLADFQPDIVKLDMGLVRGIEADRSRRIIVSSVLRACEDLGIRVVAEGVETEAERDTLRGMGVALFQGWLFARPASGALAAWPGGESRAGSV